jgi:hypothetical protein
MKPMNRRMVSTFCFAGFVAAHGFAARPARLPFDARQYVGNVVGAVVDARTGEPIPGATVVLIKKAWPFRASDRWTAEIASLLLASSVRRGSSGDGGQFLINRVPTPDGHESYTVVALAPGYKVSVFDQVPVLPGAVMSLECRFALTRGSGIGLVYAGGDRAAPYDYSHERRLRIPNLPRIDPAPRQGPMIFATREGLVGRTTANGHVVRAQDRFVALPSRRALSREGESAFQVRLRYRDKSVIAPVWDVGPWNIRDDHWSPPERREQWRDLRQGLPQAQAAYQNGHNGGRDGFGRRVSNPAGIDLADGTFWRDLAMRDNDWVSVEYLWSPDVAQAPAPETTERREPSTSPTPRQPPRRRSIAVLSEILRTARVILGRNSGTDTSIP